MMESYANIYDLMKVKMAQLKEEGINIKSNNEVNKGTLKEDLIELPHQFFKIENSSATILNLPSFRTQPWWMAAELLTEFLALNPPLMNKYSPDTIESMYKLTPQGTCEYGYGTRWANWNQIENARKKLALNPTSKKVIIQTWEPQDMFSDKNDSPCNVNYMLLGRNGKLDLTATIRSNDIMRGVKYDYYLASFMQQSLASWTNMIPGDLYFSINSLHTYGKDAKNLDNILSELNNNKELPISLVLPSKLESLQYWNDFRHVKKCEEAAYNGAWDSFNYQNDKITIPLFRDFARIFAVKNAKHYEKPHMAKRYNNELEVNEVKRWVNAGK